MSVEVVDGNPYSRLMALQRMGIVENYERIREFSVAIVLLESKIQKARSKKDTLRARAQSTKFVLTSISGLMLLLVLNFSSLVKWFRKTDASLVFGYFRTATKVSEMLGNVNTSSALFAFEKMEEKGRAFRY
ncbi:hypothetical protein Syun_013894 [Stephania yunnanensis]|uniref:Uncharacterized protein n=1 Tax=Stephania yunnanensis TaxID=152371 RepID=A0AAP0JIH3_9MAGN